MRQEYPRPNFRRPEWQNLNGEWDFWFENEEQKSINVPFVFQSKASGIGLNKMCDNVVYRRRFSVSEKWSGKQVILHFGAVDYNAVVYVNGCMVGSHQGGSASFSFDITRFLIDGEQEVVVEVNDPCTDETIPRGKQYWMSEPESIYYTPSTGIWQTVWLEAVEKSHIKDLRFTSDIDSGTVTVEYSIENFEMGQKLDLLIKLGQKHIAEVAVMPKESNGKITVDIFGRHVAPRRFHEHSWCWSPEKPTLFDVEAFLTGKELVCDRVNTYFGMRKIETRDGMVWLNNFPYYQSLVLDQGYWKDTLMTAPSEEALKQDILLAKEMGFNGCRKHQKAEDPLFLYWADVLGYLVWGEIPSAPSFSVEASQRVLTEWAEIIKRDYNHPCIVCWVVLNESWGVTEINTDKQQKAHSMALYYNAKTLDSTRLVVNNDGWEMCKSDICAIHNYAHGDVGQPEKMASFPREIGTVDLLTSAMPSLRPVYADGYSYQGEPILLTECGGMTLVTDTEKDWGYYTLSSPQELLEEYRRLTESIHCSNALFGYCYTQLTDVQQETNGLLTEDRRHKVDPEKIREYNLKARKEYLTKNR